MIPAINVSRTTLLHSLISHRQIVKFAEIIIILWWLAGRTDGLVSGGRKVEADVTVQLGQLTRDISTTHHHIYRQAQQRSPSELEVSNDC